VNRSDNPSKRKHHWERFWSTSEPRHVSWYQDSPEASLHLINATRVSRDAHILDVGGGASTLVDGLIDRGFENISVLDLSASAIAHAKERLGARSEKVAWMTGDVTAFHTDTQIDLWHDRAVLHFLTEKRDRDLYVQSFTESIAPNGHAIIATFALDGPRKCSGFEVVRYGPQEIKALLGESFQLLEVVHETHLTPGEIKQRFTYFRFQQQG
jgi:2-polyprenyl-3-methyl-5-hydroxy-6-metoxy-1,4-benzoquinol methylase